MRLEQNQQTGRIVITPGVRESGFRNLGLIEPGDSVPLVMQDDGTIVAHAKIIPVVAPPDEDDD